MSDKQPAAAQDEKPVLAALFENLRNLFVCVGLAVAGIAMIRFPKYFPLGEDGAYWSGAFVVLFSAGLVVANAYDLGQKWVRGAHVWSFRYWLILLPTFTVYFSVTLAVYGVAVKVNSRQFQEAPQSAEARR